MRNYHVLGDWIEREALWSAAEVLSPLSSRRFVRVKELFANLQLQIEQLPFISRTQFGICGFDASLRRKYSAKCAINRLRIRSFPIFPTFLPVHRKQWKSK